MTLLPHPLARRRIALALTALLTGAGWAPLAGCGADGFHLRRPQALNYQRVALSGFAERSTMVDEIRRALPTGTVITPNVLDSQVVIEALTDARDTTVEASTSFGQVRELRLHVLLRYRVLRPDGTELLKAAELERYRDLTYNESVALAKDTELNTLYRDMQADIAAQLMRVLAAVSKKPLGPQAAPAAAASVPAAVPGAAPGSAPAPSSTPSRAGF